MLVQAIQRYFKVAPQSTFGKAVAACGPHLTALFWFSALINFLYLAPSIYMLQVYDRVLTTQSVETLLFVSVALILAFAAMGVLDFARGRLFARVALRLERRLAADTLEASFAGTHRRGEAQRALDSIRSVFSGPGLTALLDLPWAPIFLVVCFMLHWALGLTALAGAIVVVTLAIASERAQRKPLQATLDATTQAAISHDTAAAGADVARALGMREALLERDRGLREQAAVTGASALFAQAGFTSSAKIARLAVQSTLLGLGAYLAINGQISPGAIIASSIIATRALAPFDMLMGAWRQIVMANTGVQTLVRMFTALDAKPRGVIALPTPSARLQAQDVTVFRPNPSQGAILNAISLIVEPGEAVVVSGPSGSGKTTLAQVMVGALSPQVGAVRLDGVDLSLWSDSALGRLIGYMPQQPVLFPGNLVDNISRFSRHTGMSENEVMSQTVAAARLAGAHDMIMRLPNGYQTQVQPGGGGLSVGQAQRVSLARAVFGTPIAVVLDEPNASLDHDGETALLACIMELKKRGACVLVVAHRASLATAFDRIIILKNGEIERIGSRPDPQQSAKLGPRPVAAPRPGPPLQPSMPEDTPS